MSWRSRFLNVHNLWNTAAFALVVAACVACYVCGHIRGRVFERNRILQEGKIPVVNVIEEYKETDIANLRRDLSFKELAVDNKLRDLEWRVKVLEKKARGKQKE